MHIRITCATKKNYFSIQNSVTIQNKESQQEFDTFKFMLTIFLMDKYNISNSVWYFVFESDSYLKDINIKTSQHFNWIWRDRTFEQWFHWMQNNENTCIVMIILQNISAKLSEFKQSFGIIRTKKTTECSWTILRRLRSRKLGLVLEFPPLEYFSSGSRNTM